jgi:hypothetical protein
MGPNVPRSGRSRNAVGLINTWQTWKTGYWILVITRFRDGRNVNFSLDQAQSAGLHNRHHNIFSPAAGNRIEFDTTNTALAKIAFFPPGEAP